MKKVSFEKKNHKPTKKNAKLPIVQRVPGYSHEKIHFDNTIVTATPSVASITVSIHVY